MARPRNPKRDEAFRLWKESNGTKALKEIAAELDVGDSQIRKWKNQDRWEDQLNGNVTKRGAPKGSKNARGNKGGKAPPGNQNAKGNKGGAAPARAEDGWFQYGTLETWRVIQVAAGHCKSILHMHSTWVEKILFSELLITLMVMVFGENGKKLRHRMVLKKRRIRQKRMLRMQAFLDLVVQ
jgi:hypothetical protein